MRSSCSLMELLNLLLYSMAVATVSAGLYGNLIGVGLADCKTSHPQLLSKWTFNATTNTLAATDNLPACKSHESCQVGERHLQHKA